MSSGSITDPLLSVKAPHSPSRPRVGGTPEGLSVILADPFEDKGEIHEIETGFDVSC